MTIEGPTPTPALKEREMPGNEDSSTQEFSKSNFAQERSALAAEISRERKTGMAAISELRVRTNLLKQKLERTSQSVESVQAELESLRSRETQQANSLTGRLLGFLNVQRNAPVISESKAAELASLQSEREETAKELEASTAQLIDAQDALSQLSSRISEHYGRMESIKKHLPVQEVMQNSKAFFVHMILADTEVAGDFDRGNASMDKSRADDLVDVILSIEPSIAVSSVAPGRDEEGKVSGLWVGESGLLIAGGRIGAASEGDMASVAQGLKNRTPHAHRSSTDASEDIERIAGLRAGENAWNEFIVHNPEASGYFRKIQHIDPDGRMWISGRDGSARSAAEYIREIETTYPNAVPKAREDLHNKLVAPFLEEMRKAEERGLPFYVMTPDRRFFRVAGVNEDGSLTTGPELTPEQAAQGRAGLTPEMRKDIGRNLLHKGIFRDDKSQEEASRIINNL
jgi:hypothetical protein